MGQINRPVIGTLERPLWSGEGTIPIMNVADGSARVNVRDEIRVA